METVNHSLRMLEKERVMLCLVIIIIHYNQKFCERKCNQMFFWQKKKKFFFYSGKKLQFFNENMLNLWFQLWTSCPVEIKSLAIESQAISDKKFKLGLGDELPTSLVCDLQNQSH